MSKELENIHQIIMLLNQGECAAESLLTLNY